MKAQVEIEAGVCGFRTQATAKSDDSQHVTFAVDTDCEKIGQLAAAMADLQPLDAFQEISPVGLFKAMQVAAGLALPKDISIRLSKSEG